MNEKCSHENKSLRSDIAEYECLDCGKILYNGPLEQTDPNPLMQCQLCYHVTRENSLISRLIHAETMLEPAEFENSCPEVNCYAYGEQLNPLDLDEICESCGEDIKFNDGNDIHDQCHDCYIAGCEAAAEAANDR